MKTQRNERELVITLIMLMTIVGLSSCRPKTATSAFSEDAAVKTYVAPGNYDEFYNFVSGGFSGQLAVYGIPSGRLLKVLPVFSVNAENGWGFSEETKPMLNTSFGEVPWDDSHHPNLSMTNGEYDGRWVFINANNTPRIARIDLKTFKTVEILELPNSAGNHPSSYVTENSEYIVAGTRFSVPPDYVDGDVPISSYKENFKGHLSFVSIDPVTGEMKLSFQLAVPGFNYDLSHPGKGKSHGWFFFTCYNSEQAHTHLEVNASQNDKDFVLAINWKKVEEHLKAGKGETVKCRYAHNMYDEKTHMATSRILEETTVLKAEELKDCLYYIPCPKSPHGIDVDPTGEYIVASGKLATVIPVFSFDKIQKAIEDKSFEGEIGGIDIINYDAALYGEVQNPGLGTLHTEFDDKGNAYSSFFVSSEIVKWNIKDLQVLDRIPSTYSVGHLSVLGGDTRKPYGKYLIAYNKITKDRFLPTGPELAQCAQLIDISGDKMKLLLDFPTIGEPHYAVALPADMIKDKQKQYYLLNENQHPYVARTAKEAKVTKEGNVVHVNIIAIRSHMAPDNIEGIMLGDTVYFHLTNIEQEWDIPHGFAVKGNTNAELLVMPGETQTLKWIPSRTGIFSFYCTDFCSALHQEMQGYIRVSAKGSNVPLSYTLDDKTTDK